MQRHDWHHRSAVILLAEDDPGDQELTRRALAQNFIRADLRIARDGQEALDYLLRRGPFADPRTSPRPDLILLDLNMPRLDGIEVLKRLREQSDLDRIPVVVLTTSSRHEDVRSSYELGCNSFIEKPVDVVRFAQGVGQLGHYWFELVTLPTLCVNRG